MIQPGETLTPRDVEAIARLHLRSIDDSLPSLLGLRYLKRFYRFLARSRHEWVFVERIDGDVHSVCVVSFEPASVNARILRATPVALGWHAAAAILRNPAFRSFLRHYLRERLRGGGADGKAPEITYIFTSEARRGERLGRRLVERVEAFLRERGVGAYHVKTLDDPANRALSFYDEIGFDRIGTRAESGRSFVEFRKRIAAG